MTVVPAWLQLILLIDDKLGSIFVKPKFFYKAKSRDLEKRFQRSVWTFRVEQECSDLLRVIVTANTTGSLSLEELKQGYQFPDEEFNTKGICWLIKYRNPFLRMVDNWSLTKR